MTAGTYDLVVEQGATFRLPLLWIDEDQQPIDLTNAVVRMQIREQHNSPVALLTLTSLPLGAITITNPGQILVVISDEQTALLTIPRGVWDLKVEWIDGTSVRLLQGRATIVPSTTVANAV